MYIVEQMSKLFLLLLVASFSNVFSTSIMDRFHQWVDNYHFQFRDDAHFYDVYRKWAANDRYIEVSNSQNLSYTLDHNQFSGMDNNDFRKYLLSFDRPYVPENNYVEQEIGLVPKSVDWVASGAVTSVKDQGQCGSCWSFSTTGSLEGAYFLKYGTLLSFSEQQLVDCDTFSNGGRDHGCNGGLMDNAFSWIKKNGGLCSENDYPYVSGTTKTAGTCKTTCAVNGNSKVQSFVDVKANSDDAMLTALAQQPVSVAIEADQTSFQLYKSGVFTGTCGTNLDHGVLVVGYGTDGALDYYKVKNSWGTTWGESGYIRLGRGSSYNKGAGQCGVLMQASYPVL